MCERAEATARAFSGRGKDFPRDRANDDAVVSLSPFCGDTPQRPGHRAYSPLVELRRSSAAEIRPLLLPMPYRGQRDRSAGTFPVSADHADGLDSPVSTLPCMSRSSLQQAFRLRQRIPAQPTPQNKEPNRKRSLPGLSTYRNG